MIHLMLLIALAQTANPVEQKLSCMEALDNGPEPKAEPLLISSQLRAMRIESIDVYSDGSVLTQTQLRHNGGLKSCRAKVTKERLEAFKAELERSGICSLSSPKRDTSDEYGTIHLNLGPKQRCDLRLSASIWTRKSETRSVQMAIDRLRSDLCGGPCADPKPPRERFQLVKDPIKTVRPDPAPPKKP